MGHQLSAGERSILAVALTAMLLMVWGIPVELQSGSNQPTESNAELPVTAEATAVVADAAKTMAELAGSFVRFLPRLLIALGLLFIAAVTVRLANVLLKRALGAWQRTAALVARKS